MRQTDVTWSLDEDFRAFQVVSQTEKRLDLRVTLPESTPAVPKKKKKRATSTASARPSELPDVSYWYPPAGSYVLV